MEEIKRGRGRPPKKKINENLNKTIESNIDNNIQLNQSTFKRRRGRPRKNIDTIIDNDNSVNNTLNVVQNNNTNQISNDECANNETTLNSQEIEQEEVKELTPKKQELYDYYEDIKQMATDTFGVTIPKNDMFKCTVCHRDYKSNEFFRSYSLGNIGCINNVGERHLHICKRCSKKIFKYYRENSDSLYKTVHHWCQTLDLYFSKELYDLMIQLHNSRKGTEIEYKFDYATDYITVLGRSRMIGLTYWDSPSLQNSPQMNIEIPDDYQLEEEASKEYPEEFYGWDKEDLENYDYVLEVYHYDPFIDEDVEDRKKLYYNLAGLSSEDILDDFAKANAAIDTCRSMVRLEKLNKLRIKLEKEDNPDIKDVKEITLLQKAERANIAMQGKEHGFTQKYNTSKGQGSGTFTGIIKQMDEGMFEDALVNAYDIKTSNAVSMAAEASWKAIFNQLNLSESEYAKIVQDQREMIMQLRKDLDDTKERLRLANITIKHKELEDKLKAESGDEK